MISSFDNYVLPLHPSLFEKQLSREVHSLQFIVAKYILDKTSFNVHTIGKDVLPDTLKQYLLGLKRTWDKQHSSGCIHFYNDNWTVSTGSLKNIWDGAANWSSSRAQYAITNGVHYWEIKIDWMAQEDPQHREAVWTGIVDDTTDFELLNSPTRSNTFLGDNQGRGYLSDGRCYPNAKCDRGTNIIEQFRAGDVIGHKIDFEAKTLSFYKNGKLLGTPFSNITNTPVYPAVSIWGRAIVTVTFH